MYLVYVLQSKGYPVNEIFESDVKPIPTLRFQDFLNDHPEVEDQMSQRGLNEEEKKMFSFRSDDSYELITATFSPPKKRPACVPPLQLEGLPEYESSSDEGEQDNEEQMNVNNPQYYQESMQYIENFYSKYAH